jgi:hypothetical protein
MSYVLINAFYFAFAKKKNTSKFYSYILECVPIFSIAQYIIVDENIFSIIRLAL